VGARQQPRASEAARVCRSRRKPCGNQLSCAAQENSGAVTVAGKSRSHPRSMSPGVAGGSSKLSPYAADTRFGAIMASLTRGG
jgi:hypothetical protein